MSFGLIPLVIVTFEEAVSLGRGTSDTRAPEKPTVPRADMERAAAYAKNIAEIMTDLKAAYPTFNWPAFSGVAANRLFFGAADSTRSLLDGVSRSLGGAPQNSSECPSLRGGWPPIWVTQMRLALDILEVVARERPLEASKIVTAFREGAAEWSEVLLTMTPFIGEGVLAFEMTSGVQVTTGRPLSDAERVIAGLGIIIPPILSKTIGLAVRTVGRPAARVTFRAVRLVCTELKIFEGLNAAARAAKAFELSIALRVLPDNLFGELLGLLAKRIGTFTTSELARLAYFMSRVEDVARLAQWLRIAEKELGSGLTGLGELKKVSYKKGEKEALNLLAEQSGESVVKLPDVFPTDYPGTSQIDGVKYPDALWKGELLEAYAPTTGSMKTILREMVGKQEQASTVLVSMIQHQSLSKADVEHALVEFWSNPRAFGVSRVVTQDAKGFAIFMRPDTYSPWPVYQLARMGLGDPKKLVSVVEELEKEAEASNRDH